MSEGRKVYLVMLESPYPDEGDEPTVEAVCSKPELAESRKNVILEAINKNQPPTEKYTVEIVEWNVE